MLPYYPSSMQKSILLNNQQISYLLKTSPHARHVRVSVHPGGKLKVTIPRYANPQIAENFLREKAGWIIKNLSVMREVNPLKCLGKNKKEYQTFKKSAVILIKRRVEEINAFYNFSYRKIAIRNQSSRWGSCSANKNLNFNYKIALLPRKYMDYIIAHELCHLREMNHSPHFWKLVEQKVPDYKELRKRIRKIV